MMEEDERETASFQIDTSYAVPDVLQESSLVEDMIDGIVIPADFVVTYTVEEEVSQRGRKKLLSSDGYSGGALFVPNLTGVEPQLSKEGTTLSLGVTNITM